MNSYGKILGVKKPSPTTIPGNTENESPSEMLPYKLLQTNVAIWT